MSTFGEVDVDALAHNAFALELEGVEQDIRQVAAQIRARRPGERIPPLDHPDLDRRYYGHLGRLIHRGRTLLRELDNRLDEIVAEDEAAEREAAKTPQQLLEERLARVEAENRALHARLDRPPVSAVSNNPPPPMLAAKMSVGSFSNDGTIQAGGVRAIGRGAARSVPGPMVNAMVPRYGLNASGRPR